MSVHHFQAAFFFSVFFRFVLFCVCVCDFIFSFRGVEYFSIFAHSACFSFYEIWRK